MLARSILTIAIILAYSVAGIAQIKTGKDHITYEKIVPVTAGAGDTVRIHVKAKIHKWWHTYGVTPAVGPDGLGPEATEVTVSPKSLIKLAGKPKILKGARTEYDSVWETKIETWQGNIEVEVPIVVSSSAKKGEYKATILFTMQMCDTTGCLPPDDMPQQVQIILNKDMSGLLPAAASDTQQIEHATAIAEPARTASQPATQVPGEILKQERKGLLNFFLYAMGIGFLALLTPCVFPMIPITVSFFTKRHEKKAKFGIRDSTVFGLGIISTFTTIGIVVSILFGGTAVQDWAANAWMNLAIGALFIALAFNLFGAFELQVPVSIMNKLNKKSQGDGVTAVWLMGLTFSLTSFTCTVPFVGTLLLTASTAHTAGDYLYPAVGTLGFATAFALPFVVLSMFPALLMRLPRAGGWMNNLKVVMGFIEIAAAVKFISNADLAEGWGIMPREVFLSVWAGVCILIVLYILGVFEMKLDSKVEKVSGIRASFAVVFASLTVWFGAGILGGNLNSFLEALLPPTNYQELIDKGHGLTASSLVPTASPLIKSKNKEDKLNWLDNLEEAKEIAKESGKPIFIDFTGFTCTNCRLMEKYVFSKSIVEDRFKKFVLVQLYTDRKTEPYISNQNILKSYGTVANPLYVMLKPDGTYIAQSGYQIQYQSDPSTFAAFLDQAL